MTKELWRAEHENKREVFMTEDDKKRINDYIAELNTNYSNMLTKASEWSDIDNFYANEQEEKDGRPNSKMNIICSTVEGQIAEMIEQDFSIAIKAEDPSSLGYAKTVKPFLEWVLRKNHFNKKREIHERRRLKFGIAYFKIGYDKSAFGGFGLPLLETPGVDKIVIDPIVASVEDLEKAEYIYELINMGKVQAEMLYGSDKAEMITYGHNSYWDSYVFSKTVTQDSTSMWTLIQRWSKNKAGKLRVEEFSNDGILLFDSFKGKDRKANQKKLEVKASSYYKYTFDRYPYFGTCVYQKEGSFYGFGDGALLLPLQKMINNLYDKIMVAARPNMILINSTSNVDVDGFDEDSFQPVYYDSSASGAPPVHVAQYGTVNDSWWRLLDYMRNEAQRVVRFSDIMTGGGSGGTATEASINQKQGAMCAFQKKVQFSDTIQDCCEFMVNLAQEYGCGRFFKGSKEGEFKYVDLTQNKIPIMKPASSGYQRAWKEEHPDKEMPKYELTGGFKNPEFDIEITLGAGLPKTPAFLYNLVEKLSQMQTIDMQGQPKPVVSFEELRGFIKEFLGLNLNDEQAKKIFEAPMPEGQTQTGQTPNSNIPNQNEAQMMANKLKNEGGM